MHDLTDDDVSCWEKRFLFLLLSCVCVCTFLFLISAVLFCCAIPFSVGKRQATPISRLIEGRIILDSVKEEQVARRRNDHKNKAKKERKKGATWSAFYYYFVRKKKDVRLTLRGRTEKRRRRGNCYITLMLFSLLLLCLPFYLCCVPVCFCRRNPSASLSLSSIRDFHFTRAPAPFGRRRDNLKCCGEDRENKMG